jgi:hypothetical protein
MIKNIIFTIFILNNALFANIEILNKTEYREAKKNAFIHYKESLKFLDKGDYKHSFIEISKAISNYKHKKYKDLYKEIRMHGNTLYEDGLALYYFDKKLCLKYMKNAQAVLSHKDKRQKKINKIIKYIEKNQKLDEESISSESVSSEDEVE